jgi:hypothetical protein
MLRASTARGAFTLHRPEDPDSWQIMRFVAYWQQSQPFSAKKSRRNLYFPVARWFNYALASALLLIRQWLMRIFSTPSIFMGENVNAET